MMAHKLWTPWDLAFLHDRRFAIREYPAVKPVKVAATLVAAAKEMVLKDISMDTNGLLRF